MFKVVIPDNMATFVTTADGCDPRLHQAFVEYAQWAGFFVDPSRVRAGTRTHGTTAQRPVEVFAEHEAPVLRPAPGGLHDLPIYRDAKVAGDHHVQVAKALYSVPGGLIGERVEVRADSKLVKIYARGSRRVPPRVPVGHRSTDAGDLPAEKTIYAMRDLDQLESDAAGDGDAVGAVRGGGVGPPVAVDEDAAGPQAHRVLSPLRRRTGQHRVSAGARRRDEQRHRCGADARAGPRSRHR